MVMVIGRPMPGTVGETRRVAHLFPQPTSYPGKHTALCGETFHSSDLEWLDGIHGMPCELCLVRTKTAPALTR